MNDENDVTKNLSATPNPIGDTTLDGTSKAPDAIQAEASAHTLPAAGAQDLAIVTRAPIRTWKRGQGKLSTHAPQDFKERKEKFLQALQKYNGLISYACDDVCVSVSFYYALMKRDPEFKRRVLEIQERQIDRVERKFLEKCEAGDIYCLLFYMKTKGQRRGYIERQQVEHMGGTQNRIRVTLRLDNGGQGNGGNS